MSFILPEGRAALIGILNVTPDSFSDGGRFDSFETAVSHALRMQEEGADIIDVGGESTRPGAARVSAEEELNRTLPVIQELVRRGIPVSIDTSKPLVAAEAIRAGASIVNDVTALSDPEMPRVVADSGVTICLMHMQGTPQTMQFEPKYENVVEEVRSFLFERAQYAKAAGIRGANIWLDPGIGFGKTLVHNLALLRNLQRMTDLGYPLLIGVSRKSFIAKIDATAELPIMRLPGTIAAQTWALLSGARVLRVHDVREARQALLVTEAILGAQKEKLPPENCV